MRVLTGFIWIRTNWRILWSQECTLGFHRNGNFVSICRSISSSRRVLLHGAGYLQAIQRRFYEVRQIKFYCNMVRCVIEATLIFIYSESAYSLQFIFVGKGMTFTLSRIPTSNSKARFSEFCWYLPETAQVLEMTSNFSSEGEERSFSNRETWDR
jgi:hypothetical protein